MFTALICTFQESDLENNPIKYRIFLVDMTISYFCTAHTKARNWQCSARKCKTALHGEFHLPTDNLLEACDKMVQLGLSRT